MGSAVGAVLYSGFFGDSADAIGTLCCAIGIDDFGAGTFSETGSGAVGKAGLGGCKLGVGMGGLTWAGAGVSGISGETGLGSDFSTTLGSGGRKACAEALLSICSVASGVGKIAA